LSRLSPMTDVPPILAHKLSDDPSVFTPEGLLREARRQKNLRTASVPQICVLDPDGDIVHRLANERVLERDPDWACYHTDLHRGAIDGIELRMIGCAVGASFAVLLAEQMFASGCHLLISMTSAGQLAALRPPPYFVLIDRALRDEGTSYHYLPPADFSYADNDLIGLMNGAFSNVNQPVDRGAVWTTDAPFRETEAAVEAMRARGLFAVEMEAAVLYAFASARRRPVLCFAHVTNQMAQVHGDFEKGEADGTTDAIAVILAAARAWLRAQNETSTARPRR
jgi:uridine phosphorylase